MKAREIADLLSATLTGDGEVEIVGVGSLDTADPNELAFTESEDATINGEPGCLLAPAGFANSETRIPSVITVPDPKLAFARTAEVLHPLKTRAGQVHPTAIIARSASLGQGVFIGAFVSVGENSSIGDGSHLRAG